MPGSGSGTGTPITAGIGTNLALIEPLPYTLLSLPRFARIMGINPVHFQGAHGQTVWPLADNNCNDLWPRYSWQYTDQVSHYELARTIAEVEAEIADYLGWWPAPVWIAGELLDLPSYHRPDIGWRSHGIRSTNTKYGKIIGAGRRAVSLVGAATTAGGSLAYTDENGDGYAETATITLPTALTDVNEIKAYFTGTDGELEWEIRHPRSKVISGGNVVLVFDSWLLIDPELQSQHPHIDGFAAIEADDLTSYVTSVEVYREYNDATQVTAQLIGPATPSGNCPTCYGAGCPTCAFTITDGCLTINDPNAGIVTPAPASYDADTGDWIETWSAACYDTNQAKVWYYAGERSSQYHAGRSIDPLDHNLATAIAYMTVARLERELVGCGNSVALSAEKRVDLARVGEDQSFFSADWVRENPFGTRRGEVEAFQRLGRSNVVRNFDAVII